MFKPVKYITAAILISAPILANSNIVKPTELLPKDTHIYSTTENELLIQYGKIEQLGNDISKTGQVSQVAVDIFMREISKYNNLVTLYPVDNQLPCYTGYKLPYYIQESDRAWIGTGFLNLVSTEC